MSLAMATRKGASAVVGGCLTVLLLAVAAGCEAAVLKDGSACFYDKAYVPQKPFCKGNSYNCVVDKVNPANLTGRCNSTIFRPASDYCQFRSVPFKIGTKAIRAKSTCVTCTCVVSPKVASGNRAECKCEPLPPCYVDYNGTTVGKACPNPQSECQITKTGGGGKSKNGRPIDVGNCVFPGGEGGGCGSAGPNFNQKFYANGTTGVPFPGNRCKLCTCINSTFTKCKIVPKCKDA